MLRGFQRFLLLSLVALMLTIVRGGCLGAVELPVVTAADGGQVTPEAVRGLLEAYLTSQSELLPAETRVEFKSIERFHPFALPAGKATCEIVPANPAIIGSRRFSLIFRVDDRVEANIALRVNLEALAPVVVTAIDLPRNTVLTLNDVRLVERNIVGLRDYYQEISPVLGKGTRRSMKAGEVLQKGVLATLPVIRRGEQVTMTVKSDQMVLTAGGSAMENGGVGETIRVRNNSSQKEVSGRVVGPGKVEVGM